MRYILFIVLTVFISGCATIPKYIEPVNGEYATLSIPHNKTKYSFGFSGEVYNIAILNENDCVDSWYKVEKKAEDKEKEIIKIPADKKIAISALLYIGNSTCRLSGFFEAEKNEHYNFSTKTIKRTCFMYIDKIENNKTIYIKIKPLKSAKMCSAKFNAQNKEKKLSLVKENHAELFFNGAKYILDSYIVLFENPYYITIEREDKEKIEYQEAIDIAIDYIKPRGCTSPLKRLPNLDKHNENKTKWTIGISC